MKPKYILQFLPWDFVVLEFFLVISRILSTRRGTFHLEHIYKLFQEKSTFSYQRRQFSHCHSLFRFCQQCSFIFHCPSQPEHFVSHINNCQSAKLFLMWLVESRSEITFPNRMCSFAFSHLSFLPHFSFYFNNIFNALISSSFLPMF